MATVLTEVIDFTAVGVGAIVALPHNINVNGTRWKPDLIFPSSTTSGFTVVSCTTTTLTVQNTGIGIASASFVLWHLHSYLRAFGPTGSNAIRNMTPQPFVTGGGSGGGGGATLQAFRYTCTGAEGSDFNVTLPAARPNDTYFVEGDCAGVAGIMTFDFPDLIAGDRTTTQFRVISSVGVTLGDQIDFMVD